MWVIMEGTAITFRLGCLGLRMFDFTNRTAENKLNKLMEYITVPPFKWWVSNDVLVDGKEKLLLVVEVVLLYSRCFMAVS